MAGMIVLGMVGVAVLGVAFLNRGLLTGGRLTGKGGSEDEKGKDAGKLLVIPAGGVGYPESNSQSVLLDAGGIVFDTVGVRGDGSYNIDGAYSLRNDAESGNLIFKATEPRSITEFLVRGLGGEGGELTWKIIYQNVK